MQKDITIQHDKFPSKSLWSLQALDSDIPHLGHSPGQLIDEAIAVAECRNLPVVAVLEGARCNVDKLFL